jgi:hypothetical protein
MPMSKDRQAKKRNDDGADDKGTDPRTGPEVGRRGTKGVAPAPDRVFLYAGIGAALIGALVLAGALWFHSKDVGRQAALLPAAGTVVEQESQNSGTQSRVLLTVRYFTASGQALEFKLRYDSKTTNRPAKGDAVRVLYDPGDPTKAELQDSGLLGYALVAAVGLGFLLMGLTLLVKTILDWRRKVAAQAARG